MAEIKVIPPGIGNIGQVILAGNKCYEIARETTDPVDTPSADVYSDCDQCDDARVRECFESIGTPAASDDCGQGCSPVPQLLYFKVTEATGVWAFMDAKVVELRYLGFCEWSGGDDASYGFSIYLYGFGNEWYADVADSGFTNFEYLYLDGATCDPTGSYTCAPFCDPAGTLAGEISTNPGPCTP